MEKAPRLDRVTDLSERGEAIVEHFSPAETSALQDFITISGTGGFTHALSSDPAAKDDLRYLLEPQLEMMRRKGNVGMVPFDRPRIARIQSLIGRFDSILPQLPRETVSRFVAIPENVDRVTFAADVLARGGVSLGNEIDAVRMNKQPVIYGDARKIDGMILGKETIEDKGQGFALIVYDKSMLRSVPVDEYEKYANPTPFALVPAEGKKFKDAMAAVLMFENPNQS